MPIRTKHAPRTGLSLRVTTVLLGLCGASVPFVLAAQEASESAAKNATIPYQLEADDVQFDLNTGLATATGAVEVTDGEQTVRADTLTYHAKEDTLKASGNVVLTTGDGPALLVDELTLTGKMKHAALSELSLRLPHLGEVLTARQATKDGPEISLEDATYSPCQTCWEGTDRKLWSIHADKISYNTKTYRAQYRNATLDVYDVPIFYIPYFSHPIGAKTPQSGWLFPEFGTSTNTGEEATVSYYYYNPTNNADYTFRARGMSSRGLMGMLERRQNFGAWDTEIRTSVINDERRNTTRGHAKVIGEYTFQKGRRMGLNGEISSDDVYLNDFFGRNDSYLPSTLYAEDANQNEGGGHYFGVAATHFQDLQSTRDPANTAHSLPHIQWQRYWQLANDGTQLTTNVDGLVLHRSEGTLMRRVVGSVDVAKPWLLPDEFLGGGHLVTLSAEARADLYHVENAPDDASTIRALGQLAAKWERPVVNAKGTHVITPVVMGIIAPRGGNAGGDIPNEDSVAYELDTNNLFSTNRYAGYDRVESGPRLIYGLENRWGEAGHERWKLFLGQSWRKFDDEELPASGGTSTAFSDWVGAFSGKPTDWLKFSSQFRLDNAEFSAQRMDNYFLIGHTKKTYFQTTHTLLQGGPEELALEAGWQITPQMRLTGETRRDITDGAKQLYGKAELAYIYDCVELAFSIERNGYNNADVQPSTDYMININLLSLGSDTSK